MSGSLFNCTETIRMSTTKIEALRMSEERSLTGNQDLFTVSDNNYSDQKR